MPIDEGTVQQLAQERAKALRLDDSRPKANDPYAIKNPYEDVIAQEKSTLADPRNAPGTAGFERELQTQTNQSQEKLRSRIAGVADPLAVGREMARMDQATRNQLAVYMSQQQADARNALRQAAAGSAQFQLQQGQQAEQQRQFDVGQGENRFQFDVGQSAEQQRMAAQQQQFGQSFGENQRQFNQQQAQQASQFGQTFGEGQRQFNVGQGNFQQTFGENQRQFNQNYGLDVQRQDLARQQYETQRQAQADALEVQRAQLAQNQAQFEEGQKIHAKDFVAPLMQFASSALGGPVGSALGQLFSTGPKTPQAAIDAILGVQQPQSQRQPAYMPGKWETYGR